MGFGKSTKRKIKCESNDTAQLEGKIAAKKTPVIELEISSILIRDGRRPLNKKFVKSLAKSIERGGLKYPVDVYPLTDMYKGKFQLAAGAHRIAAFQYLGKATIPVKIIGRHEAKVWEESENLHRSDLTFLERSEAIVRYARAIQVEGAGPFFPWRKQPHDKGFSELERQLGYSRKIIAEAFLHNSIPEKLKLLIRPSKVAQSRKLLETVAKMAAGSKQDNFVKGLIDPSEAEAAQNDAPSSKQPRSENTAKKKIAEAVEELSQIWEVCDFKKVFDDQPINIQRAFVKSKMA